MAWCQRSKVKVNIFLGGAKSRKMFKLTSTIMLMIHKYYFGVVMYSYQSMMPKVKGQGQFFGGMEL